MANQDVKSKDKNVEFDDRGFIKSGTEAEKRKLKNLQRDITKRDIMFIKSVKNPTDKKNQNFVRQAHIDVNTLDKNDVMADDGFEQISRMSNMYHNLIFDMCNGDYYSDVNPRSVMGVLGPYESTAARPSSTCSIFGENSYVVEKLFMETSKAFTLYDKDGQFKVQCGLDYGSYASDLRLNADSASVIYLAWSKQASDELRKAGCNEDAVKKAYKDKIGKLEKLCDDCQIPRSELYGTIRSKISEITNEDAQLIADMKPILGDTIYKTVSPRDAEFKTKQSSVWQKWYEAIDVLNEHDEKLLGKAESKTKESDHNNNSQAKQTDEPKKTEQARQNGQKSQSKKILKDKSVYLVEGSDEERRYLNQLKDDITNTDVSFMDYNASVSDISSNDYDSQMGRMNQMYYRMMLGQCVRPLMYGVNPTSILQTVGMYAGMALVNKGFRQNCNTMIQQQLYPVAEKLPIKYQKKMMLNHELPIGLDSAAMMHLSWTKQAYDKMREPGANVSEIMNEYAQATNALQERCQRSGISSGDLNKMVRIKVGQLAQKNPEILTLFSETAYQQVTMDDFHKETQQIQGKDGVESYVATVWSGEFTDNTGELSCNKKGEPQAGAPYDGTFTPRPPCTMNDMMAGYKDMLSGMKDCKTVEELDEFFVQHDMDSDLYETMMVADGYDRNTVVNNMSAVNKAAMKDWMTSHPDETDNLKEWASQFAKKMNTQYSARQKTGAADRKVPTKFEDILQDSGEYYNYSMDKF